MSEQPPPHPWTPGPWEWYGNTEHAEPYLATVRGGRVFVLQPTANVETCQCCDIYDDDTEEYTRGCDTESAHRARAGLRFQGPTGYMVEADKLALYEVVGYKRANPDDRRLYRHDFAGLDHPDAKLIALAPEMAEAILAGPFGAGQCNICYIVAGPGSEKVTCDDPLCALAGRLRQIGASDA